MRKCTSIIFVLVLFIGLSTQTGLAREVTVLSMQNGGVVDGLAQTIIADSAARAAALPERTTYVLDNGGTYPIITTIEPIGYFLHIRTADPAGAKAALVPSMREDEGYNRILDIRSDTKLENLIIEALRSYIDGALDNTRQNIRLWNGAKLTAIGCVIAHDRKGDAIGTWELGSSIFLEDCMLHSCGHFRDMGGNGRGIDARAAMDTLSIVNCTLFNFTGSAVVDFFREGIQVVLFDHNTVMNVGGATFQLGMSPKSTVTNNIFANGNLWGNYPPHQIIKHGPDWEPTEEATYVMSLDTMEVDWEHFVANNNVFWDQEYKNMWALSDTIVPPGVIQPTLADNNSFTGDATFEEALTFAAPPPSNYDYYAATFADPTAVIFPPVNFYFGLASDIDLSYGTTAASYTAAGGGFPLGDLNYYPDKKVEWEAAGRPLTAIENETNKKNATNFELLQNYPNPFNPTTEIKFNLKKSDVISLKVYDVLGKEVATLVNKKMNAGKHSIDFDASNLSSGTYFYKITSGGQVAVRKMLLLK